MYWSIRKAFSGFRSLSVDASPSTDHDDLPTWRRFSMPKIEEPSNVVWTPREKPPSRIRASSDSGISSHEKLTPNFFHSAPPLPEATPNKGSHLNNESFLQALLRENKILRNENTYLKYEARIREEELAKFRSESYAQRFNAAVRKHILGSTSEGRKPPPLQLPPPPLRLHRSAESTTGEAASRKGATTGVIQPDAALVSSSRTIPTVCPEAMTCKTTRAIKDANNAARGPRAHKVRESTRKIDLISGRSSISILGQEERKINDKQPKTGSASVPTTVGFTTSSNVGSNLRYISHTPVSFCHRSGRNLTPLASEVFKDEIKDSLPRVNRMPFKKLSSLLNEVDVNTGPRINSCSAKQSIQYSNTSAKAIGKRKAILLESSPLDSTIDVHSQFAVGGRSNGLVESHHPSTPMLETSTTRSPEDSEALSVEKTLLSLERICAGFSSGSLGSLESTPDPSSMNDPLPAVPLFVVDNNAEVEKLLSVQSRASFGPESPSFSCLSVKTSTPLVSRYRPSILSSTLRAATKPSVKIMPHSTARTPRKSASPLHLTKVTSALSSSPSQKKKTLCKNTPPLRIAKKGKKSVSVRPSPVRVRCS